MAEMFEALRAPAEKCQTCGHHVESHESWHLAWTTPEYPFPPNVVRRSDAKLDPKHGCIHCGCRAVVAQKPANLSPSQAWW